METYTNFYLRKIDFSGENNIYISNKIILAIFD